MAVNADIIQHNNVWMHANWARFFSIIATQQFHDHFMRGLFNYHTYMKDISKFQISVGGEQRRNRNLKFKLLYIRKVLSRKCEFL